MSSEIIFSILVIGSIPIAFFVCWTIYSLEDTSDSSFDKELMEDSNYFKWIAYGVASISGLSKLTYKKRTKSGIDKEIAEEEKEIAELERHKEKIDTLAELKRRKEKLFEEVHDKEYWECTACGDEFETLRDYGRHVSEAHHS